ncbi:hypothetical protein LTR37_012061 [Vermiconidia calcicola]|uniref:Uncharacterized protein n=1 Tax=Vermiconidia calcicola TaxID=1690605 RepID=A0ACC3N109_9PEZI|nr:hypothetical protein LTR37_012061 [Vermiconidia calcicola]
MADQVKQQLERATKAVAEEARSDYAPRPYNFKAPGRLGDPMLEPKDDPRVNSKLLEAVTPLGMHKFSAATESFMKLNADSSLDEIAKPIVEFETGISAIYNGAIPLDIPSDKDEIKIEQTEQTIKGGDGQAMKVYIYRPADQGDGKLPSVVYLHGGGMVINTTFNPVHDRWCRSMAANGAVVVMPDFRNAYTKEGYNHFPKGLNDCAAAVKWTIANRDSLKIRNIVIQGESGGGNLSCAVALKANREGWVGEIAGIFASVPYISNLWGSTEERKLKEFPSMIENHGYFLNSHVNAFMGYFYTPNEEDAVDPLAWPYHATSEDMKGLPPHVVVMDELDPLRDEGINYHRRLVQAGVESKGSVNLGVFHGSALLFRKALPELHRGVARDVVAFAREV